MTTGLRKKAQAHKIGRPSTGWLDENLASIASAKIVFNQRRRRHLASIALRHLQPQDLIKCLMYASFPSSSIAKQAAWKRELFIDQPAVIMRKECGAFGTSADSILKVPPEKFSLSSLITETQIIAPSLARFLSKLLEADRPSREEQLTGERHSKKTTRVAFIISQIAFSRSQQNNSFQSFLGTQFKFSGLSEACNSLASDLGISVGSSSILSAVSRLAASVRQKVIDRFNDHLPIAFVVDNLNLLARVCRGGGGHQNEMHNLTNVIALCPTNQTAIDEYTSLRLQHEVSGPVPLQDDWESQQHQFVVSPAERAFLTDRKMHRIATIAAKQLLETTGQDPGPIQPPVPPFPSDADLLPPKVELLPVTLMDYDENKVDEVVVINDELIHVVQCTCHLKPAKGRKKRPRGTAGAERDSESEDLDASSDDEMLDDRRVDCSAVPLMAGSILVFGDALTCRNIRKATFLRLNDSHEDLRAIQALPADWHAVYELVKIIHKRFFGTPAATGSLAWLRQLTNRFDCDEQGTNFHGCFRLIQDLAELHISVAVQAEIQSRFPTPPVDASFSPPPTMLGEIAAGAAKRLFKNVPNADKSSSATRDRYIKDFMHHAVIMLDMYNAIQHNRPSEVVVHWKFLLETCIVGSEANYVREAVNVIDALTSDCVLPPHIKYLAKHYRNVIVSDRPNAPCRPADHVLEEQNMVVKDLIRRSDGKWSIRFLDDMALAAVTSRSAQQEVTRLLHPSRKVSSRHADGDISTELKNAQRALALDFAQVNVCFPSIGIDQIETKYYDRGYIAGRIKSHWHHVRAERGQVMTEAVTALEGCTCEYCV